MMMHRGRRQRLAGVAAIHGAFRQQLHDDVAPGRVRQRVKHAIERQVIERGVMMGANHTVHPSPDFQYFKIIEI